MEDHRLTGMPVNYDPRVFNDIYAKTKDLRRKLVSQIDHRRFGLEKEDISSFFDVKFLFAFNKYYDRDPEILKAYIIRSLQFCKNRILRYSYSAKNSVHLHSNKVDVEEVFNSKAASADPEYNESQFYLNALLSHLKKELSPEAYSVLQVELKPPHYVLKRLTEKQSTAKIPSTLIAEYLGLQPNYIPLLKKEISQATQRSKNHFSKLAL